MITNFEMLGASLLRTVLRILKTKKIQRHKVLFVSYSGKQYSCNPKYIYLAMKEMMPGYDFYWAFNEPEKFSFMEKEGVHLLKYNSWEFIKACMDCGYIITNVGISCFIPMSAPQLLINTWHGGGAYKKVGVQQKKLSWNDKKRMVLERKNPQLYLSSSKIFTELTIRQSLLFDGEVLEIGMPRNDMLLNLDCPEIIDKVYNYYHLDRKQKILIYAPTYREDKEARDYELDYKKIRNTLQQRFGGEWVILFRAHYHVMRLIRLKDDDKVIDASGYPDMQELLYASEVLITDYSSCMWDFSLMMKPCFIFAPDLEKYVAERDFYIDIHQWPFSLAENNDELLSAIRNYDDISYRTDVKKHHMELGSYETGHAAQYVAEYIKNRESYHE